MYVEWSYNLTFFDFQNEKLMHKVWVEEHLKFWGREVHWEVKLYFMKLSGGHFRLLQSKQR